VQKQSYLGFSENSSLGVGLPEQTRDFGSARFEAIDAIASIVDVLPGHQVEQNGHEPGVLDAFASSWAFISGDGQPEDLANFHSAPGWMATLIKFIDLVGEQARHCGTEGSRKFGLQ
jgi:hypothetical protein